ncbi:MAG: hypothetical protein ACYDAR_05115 [Thermomicrobiales bacterium]
MAALPDWEIRPRLSRRRVRRWLNVVRVFTMLAAVVALVGFGGSLYAWRQIDRAQAAAQQQLHLIASTASQSAQTLRSVTDASTQGAATVDTATMSLTRISATVRITAGTIETTAGAFNFTIPITNVHPLAGVDASFRQAATQLRSIATEIDTTTTSLAANGSNLRTIAQEVQTIAQNTDVIANELLRLADGPGSGSVPAIARDVRLILIWSVVLHLLVLGFAITLYILATALRQLTYEIPHIAHRDDD